MLRDGKEELELAEVWYGDQRLVPDFPVAIVEAGPKRREFNGTHRWDVQFTTTILVVFEEFTDLEEVTIKNQEHADAVERFLHKDDNHLRLGGLVIFGHVTRHDPGVSYRGGVMRQASRLTHTANSREEF
jgi:hypothetical protein